MSLERARRPQEIDEHVLFLREKQRRREEFAKDIGKRATMLASHIGFGEKRMSADENNRFVEVFGWNIHLKSKLLTIPSSGGAQLYVDVHQYKERGGVVPLPFVEPVLYRTIHYLSRASIGDVVSAEIGVYNQPGHTARLDAEDYALGAPIVMGDYMQTTSLQPKRDTFMELLSFGEALIQGESPSFEQLTDTLSANNVREDAFWDEG